MGGGGGGAVLVVGAIYAIPGTGRAAAGCGRARPYDRDMSGLAYSEVGGTFPGAGRPAGHNHLRRVMRVGSGRRAFEAAGAGVVQWRMHAGMRVRPAADRPRAEPGGKVTLSLGGRPVESAGAVRGGVDD